MCKISKKYKMFLIIFVIILILMLILIISAPQIRTYCLNFTKISYGTFHFDKNKEKLYLEDTLLWDTGANGSVIYEEHKDKISNRILIGYNRVIDALNEEKIVKSYYVFQFNPVSSLSIYNFFFMVTNTHKEMKPYNEIGLIGMDVISKASWVIDFNLEKVEILPQNKTYNTKEQSQLIFKYKSNLKPETQLDFSVCQFENVLIDAGFIFDFVLLKSDIEKINEIHKPIDTFGIPSYGVHSIAPIVRNGYVYDTLKINNICFNNVAIVESEHIRLIGFQFFKRFNKVFLNTKEKEFCFYK